MPERDEIISEYRPGMLGKELSIIGASRKNQRFSPTRNVRFSLYNPLRHRRLRANRPSALALMGQGGRETIIW
jgi:hypothetical protein